MSGSAALPSASACPPPMANGGATPSAAAPAAGQSEQRRKTPAQRAAEKRAAAEADGVAASPQPKSSRRSMGSARSSSSSALSSGRRSSKKAASPDPEVIHEKKGWSLKSAFSKANWGITMAKAFSPAMELGARNRVKVGVRFRPLSELEERRGEAQKLPKDFLQLELGSANVTLSNPRPPAGQEAKTDYYAFDHLFGPKSTTQKVFESLALPLVHYLLEGFNGTIFAYGQTGSGKTHSIMGSQADPGVVPRCAAELMVQLERLKRQDSGTWILKASYVQIYREVLHDLLSGTSLEAAQGADRDHKKDLRIRRAKEGIVVDNLVERPLTTADELTKLIDQGNKKRATSATLMNAASSRSHAIVILNLSRSEAATATRAAAEMSAKLHLVDLAGSERVSRSGVTGEALKEAIAINQSLSMLGTVINALTDQKGSTHIPYRSSKLTYLLEDSLGGNSHTVMIAAASPSPKSYFETLSTLQYAARAKLIVCDPRANVKGGEEDEAAAAAAAGKAGGGQGKGGKKKDFDFLPRFMREYHGPRRTWLTGEEQREQTLAAAVVGKSPPTRV